MDPSGSDFTSTEALFIAVVGFGGALVGAFSALFSGLWLEWRRESRRNRTARVAVTMELALLAGTLHTAAMDAEVRRDQLARPAWDRFAPELVHCLPPDVLRLMHLLVGDSFDLVRRAYSHMATGIDPNYWPAVQTTMLSWAYHADKINKIISENVRTKKLTSAANSDGAQFLRLHTEIESYARDKIIEDGLDPYLRLAATPDADWRDPNDPGITLVRLSPEDVADVSADTLRRS